MQFLGSLIFTTLMMIVTPLWGLLMFAVFFLPQRAHFTLARTWSRIILWLLKVFCRLDYRVCGLENIPPGAHIGMWKHSSAWETIAQMAIFPPQVWVLKRELMWVPFVGWGLACTRPIAINRAAGHSAVRQVVEQGRKRLERGYWVLIFPEGTRVPAGTTRKYGISGALLAVETGRKIVPVAHNAGHYWPRRGLMKRPGTIQVVIGPPIDPSGLEPRAVNEQVQAWIENQIGQFNDI